MIVFTFLVICFFFRSRITKLKSLILQFRIIYKFLNAMHNTLMQISIRTPNIFNNKNTLII